MIKKLVYDLFDKFGYRITSKQEKFEGYMEEEFKKIYSFCKPYTMTSMNRMYYLFKSVEYIVKNKIEGDIIECGVWKGGSSMVIAKSLQHFGDTSRNIYLYDTFEGMSEPTKEDYKFIGHKKIYESWKSREQEGYNNWCYSPISEVQKNMKKTRYPNNKTHFVKGKVEETLKFHKHKKISLLRLDTDFYESTKSEMKHLFPILQRKGILILDDYGNWAGSKKAVDEYFKEHKLHPMICNIDGHGRMVIK